MCRVNLQLAVRWAMLLHEVCSTLCAARWAHPSSAPPHTHTPTAHAHPTPHIQPYHRSGCKNNITGCGADLYNELKASADPAKVKLKGAPGKALCKQCADSLRIAKGLKPGSADLKCTDPDDEFTDSC